MPDIDEDIVRQLMTRATEDLVAPRAAVAQALRRQRRHRARVRVTAVAGTAAAAGLAAGVLLPGTGGGARPAGAGASSGLVPSGSVAPARVRLTAAQRELFSLSAAAAAASRPDGRYVVLTEQTTSTDSGGPSGATTEKGPKTSVIDTLTGGGVTYQGITVTNANGTPTPPSVLNAPKGTSPTRAQLDAMPTGGAALRAALLARARRQIAQAQQFMEQKVRAEQKQLYKQGKKVTLPSPSQPRLSDDDLVFEQAADMLWEPHLSPQLRAALYKVLAATPGVTVQAGATDSSGRPATLISRRADSGGYTVKTYENPRTGATLESAWAGPGSSFDEDLYQSIRYTDTIPPNPYKA